MANTIRPIKLSRRKVLTAAALSAPWTAGCNDDTPFVRAPLLDAGAPTNDGGSEGIVLPESVAGIRIPDSVLCKASASFAFGVSSNVLSNHVMRTYLFSALLFQKLGTAFDEELVFVGSMLHDLGLVDEFMSPAERFELDGADAAMKFLTEQGVSEARSQVVWDAVALHTSVSIASRKAPEIAMVSIGAAMDAAGLRLGELTPESVAAVLEAYPRLDFKADAVRTMTHLCEKKPLGQVLHPFADVGRRHLSGFVSPTIEDLMLAAPFDG